MDSAEAGTYQGVDEEDVEGGFPGVSWRGTAPTLAPEGQAAGLWGPRVEVRLGTVGSGRGAADAWAADAAARDSKYSRGICYMER